MIEPKNSLPGWQSKLFTKHSLAPGRRIECTAKFFIRQNSKELTTNQVLIENTSSLRLGLGIRPMGLWVRRGSRMPTNLSSPDCGIRSRGVRPFCSLPQARLCDIRKWRPLRHGIHLESLLVQQLPVFLSAQAPMVKRLSSIFAYGFLYRTWVP